MSSSKKARLDRFISQTLFERDPVNPVSKKQVRLLLAQGRIRVNGRPAESISQPIDFFSRIELDGELLQSNRALYLMLYKPVGVVTAVTDDEHKTVIDLIDHPDKAQLHHVGRLDLNTSGLLLLTNDGDWSTVLTLPDKDVEKCYEVELARPVNKDYVPVFEQGIWFDYEGITTRPARLEILDDYHARVWLTEGRYHQVKRMFGHFRNEVVKLHRSSLGSLQLDPTLKPGQWRALTLQELEDLNAEGAPYSAAINLMT
ncbi:pseudouridine synthase [Oceanospirillum linum]|uniref:Pseudouridine synthase n=1 Tax=Oceanospirillum linum TaxID=966 RepID=A0A1T1HA74_OCELI|nr:pseudouridine synthase [Oceanospirillum linum]OOV86759.1 16S rRNA pseudouridine(516) synthase [Oceanospirillum linum]SEG23348.1 16S rRNA pseudouridine516 synthase [Oleiphilus messinensis]SMP25563.1 16S rRNA pseudouridine516 synthase [Oceanospirillum linum]